MSNKKGFTLIELIVTIAVMLSILTIAIVSFVNISNKKKEQAWEKVKEQSELAAEEYFETYKYYLENLNDNGSYARVSIGKLVEEDFLNKVTDPRSGKSVNKCDYVEVTLNSSGAKYIYTYKTNKDNSNCDVNSYVIVSEVGAPKISVDITSGVKNNDYYVTDVGITATVKTNGNGAIKKVKYCTISNEDICDATKELEINNENKYTVTNNSLKNTNDGVDGKKVTTYFTATNASGKTVVGSVTYMKDTKNPSCGTNDGSTTWIKGSRTINQKCSDETSGCTKDLFTKEFKNTTKTSNITITDNAGNVNTCNVNVYVDNSKPTCGTNNGSTTWTNKDRTITQECSDLNSGCNKVEKTYSKTQKTDTITISDNVGNTNTCNVNVYVDKDKPSCSVSISGSNKNGDIYKNAGWYTSTVTITGTCSDSNSGCTKNVSKSFENEKAQTSESPGIVYDKAGNNTTCGNKIFGIDWTAPIFNSVKRVNESLAAGHSNHIQISPSDNISGINKVTFRHCYVGDSKKSWYCSYKSIDQRNFGNAITQPTNGYYILNLKDEVTVKFEFKLYDNAGNTRTHGPLDYALPN